MLADVFRDVHHRRNQPIWLILSFQAGFMNAGGFLALNSFVSHVTGYGTRVGMALGEHSWFQAFELALAPICFLTGAAYAGWLVDRRLMRGQEPRVLGGAITIAALNAIVYAYGEMGYFGHFGGELVLHRNFFMLFALCFACGLQNGLFTGLTSGQVRTTHMTGPSTDIGLGLVKTFSTPRDDPERQKLAIANSLRIRHVLCFSGGSMIATYVFMTWTYEGFVVPLATSLILVVLIQQRLAWQEVNGKHAVANGS